jgi:transposase-like protein
MPPACRGTSNSLNGYSIKRLTSQHGKVLNESPRDRDSSFERQFVRKGAVQTDPDG